MSAMTERETILVVDDTPAFRAILERLLEKQFHFVGVDNGKDAISLCATEHPPGIVLLDLSMPGLDGIETCRQIKGILPLLPVIIVTASEDIADHLSAYEVGCDDIIVKPINKDILLKKVNQAVSRRKRLFDLEVERNDLQKMAMTFLSTMGESGALLHFTRAGAGCRSFEQLADQVIKSIGELGGRCSVMLRDSHGACCVIRSVVGEATQLEASALKQLSTMGRLFEFKGRLVVNYEHITVVVTGLPVDDPERLGRLRDNITIITESAEGLSEVVAVRVESAERAEQLQVMLSDALLKVQGIQDRHANMLVDIGICLQDFVQKVERTFSYLDTSAEQEQTISNTMSVASDAIIKLLHLAAASDHADFEAVLDIIRGKSIAVDVELF